MSKVPFRPSRAQGIAARLFAIGLSLTALASATESSKSETEPASASDCLSFEQDPVDSGVEYRLSNICKKRFVCSLEWTVSCGDNPPFHQYHHKAAVSLAAKGDQSIKADVSVCKKNQGWAISDPAWACSPQ